MKRSLTSTAFITAVSLTLFMGNSCRPDKGTTPIHGHAGPVGDGQRGPLVPGPGTTITDVTPVGQTPLKGTRDISDPNRPHDSVRFQANTVYFAYDSSTVKNSEKNKLNEVVSFLKSNPSNDILVEGHCDERGTESYNLSLGDKRALAVREALIALGAPADNIHTVSYGEAKPAAQGHNEAAWSKNRRGVFVLILPAQ